MSFSVISYTWHIERIQGKTSGHMSRKLHVRILQAYKEKIRKSMHKMSYMKDNKKIH